MILADDVPTYEIDNSVQLHAVPPEDDEEEEEEEEEDEEDANEDFEKALMLTAQGRKTEKITLVKGETGSLGFGVIGLKSEHRGELGIFVQDIQPGGVAARSDS